MLKVSLKSIIFLGDILGFISQKRTLVLKNRRILRLQKWAFSPEGGNFSQACPENGLLVRKCDSRLENVFSALQISLFIVSKPIEFS